MASLLFTLADEILVREIMTHVRYNVLVRDEPRVYLCLERDGTFRMYWRQDAIKNTEALLLVVFRRNDGLAIDVRSDLASSGTPLHQWISEEAAKGSASREDCNNKRLEN